MSARDAVGHAETLARGDGRSSVAAAIERYVHSGDYEHDHPEWSGQNIVERSRRGHEDLLSALVAEVEKRAKGRTHTHVPQLDLASWTRQKLTPMVHGFFPKAEREPVLRLFEKSVVFLTSENVESVLRRQSWLRSAWDLANLYLSSVNAELLGPDAPSLLGLSEGTTCYVSADYFAERGQIEDFVIHEAAHVFHNCKRRTAGLPHTRAREWLLELEFVKRETFAYSCEAYGSIAERATSRRERLALAEAFAEHGFGGCDESLNPTEVAEIVRAACEARNGWKVILSRCSPAGRKAKRAAGRPRSSNDVPRDCPSRRPPSPTSVPSRRRSCSRDSTSAIPPRPPSPSPSVATPEAHDFTKTERKRLGALVQIILANTAPMLADAATSDLQDEKLLELQAWRVVERREDRHQAPRPAPRARYRKRGSRKAAGAAPTDPRPRSDLCSAESSKITGVPHGSARARQHAVKHSSRPLVSSVGPPTP